MTNPIREEFLLGFANDLTRAEYRRALGHLFSFIAEAGGPPEEDVDFSALLPRLADNGDVLDFAPVDKEFVRSFVEWRWEAGVTPGVLAKQLRAVRRFFEFLVRRGILRDNPAAAVRTPQVGYVSREKDWLDVHEFAQLLAAAEEGNFPARDRAILTVVGVLALRPQEMAGLLVGDVQEDLRRILVHNRVKTDEGYLGLPDVVLASIKSYLAHPERQSQSMAHLFLDDQGKPYTSATLTSHLKRLAAAAGITRNVTAYMFRHSAATLLMLGGGTIFDAQGLLRHKSLKATRVYTHGIDLTQVKHIQQGKPNQILAGWLRGTFGKRE